MGFPGGSDGKESACSGGDLDLIPGLGRSPGGGHGNPLQYSCLENPYGQRSLVGYSPWGRKELDMTETLTHTQINEMIGNLNTDWIFENIRGLSLNFRCNNGALVMYFSKEPLSF